MKHLIISLCLLILLSAPVTGHTGPKEDYEEAYKIYLSAGASAAAYSGRIGELADRYLEQNGWQIDHYVQAKGRSGARYLIARKEGIPYYLVSIVGTENNDDIKADLKVDKVYFAGKNAAEFTANADKKNVSDSEPKVHKGFNEFIQAGPSAVLVGPRQINLSLPDLLLTDKTCKLYLTGHSLGGAAATLAGARLLSVGVSPQQLEVITFGAPAVGNAAFAAKFDPTLQLTRVVNSGDPVTGVLQTMVGGYRQFGREIRWDQSGMATDPHKLISYIDAAIKNYYDKRRQAIAAGVELPPVPAAAGQADYGHIYVAPLQNHLPDELAPEFWYMREALGDEYRRTIPGYVADAGAQNSDAPLWREAAAGAGCRWAIVSEVSASRIKQKENLYYIIINQTVYDVASGAAIDTAVFSTGTYNLTPLEAFIHGFRGMSDHLSARLARM